jgi:hypothetical protein
VLPKPKLTIRNLVTCCNTDITTLCSEGQFNSIFFGLSSSGFDRVLNSLPLLILRTCLVCWLHNWFCNHRTSRSCYVRFSGVLSFIALYGVSQVSVLGHWLFGNVMHCSFLRCADCMKMTHRNTSIDDCFRLQWDIYSTHNLYAASNMQHNASKTEIISFFRNINMLNYNCPLHLCHFSYKLH